MTGGGGVNPSTVMGGEPQQADWVSAADDRAQAATPGPWHAVVDPSSGWSQPSIVQDVDGKGICYDALGDGDAAFIAHARTDVPMLVAEVRRIEAERDRLRDTIQDVSRFASSKAISAHALGHFEMERAMLDLHIILERADSAALAARVADNDDKEPN